MIHDTPLRRILARSDKDIGCWRVNSKILARVGWDSTAKTSSGEVGNADGSIVPNLRSVQKDLQRCPSMSPGQLRAGNLDECYLEGFRELVIWGRRPLRYRVYMISSSHCPVRSATR